MIKINAKGLGGKFTLFLIVLFTTFYSCSDKCENEEPRARINNSGTGKASVQIKTSGGNTENINNIEPGQSSAWRSYAPGQTEFTVAIQGISDDTSITVNMIRCLEYDIVIDSANTVSSSPQERE
jgi:hypothetical protein